MSGNRKLSRRAFCRSTLVGGSALGLSLLNRSPIFAQGDGGDDDETILDPPDLAEFLALGAGAANDLADIDVDNPDLEDPRLDDPPDLENPALDGYTTYLPLVLRGIETGPAVASASGIGGGIAATTKLSNRERALQAAIKRLGYHEVLEPGGYNNLNKFSGYFVYHADNKRGIIRNARRSWCADFASWAFDRTGNNDGRVPWINPASVSAIKSWGERFGHIHTRPARGDIFVMKGFWRGRWRSHCGIVRKVNWTTGKFLAVEGNTNRPLSKQKAGAPSYNAVIWVAHQRRNINQLTDNGTRLYHFVRVPANPPR
jgi:hypothetical protein